MGLLGFLMRRVFIIELFNFDSKLSRIAMIRSLLTNTLLKYGREGLHRIQKESHIY